MRIFENASRKSQLRLSRATNVPVHDDLQLTAEHTSPGNSWLYHLPPEIWEEVAQIIHQGEASPWQNLQSLGMTCRSLRRLVQPYQYKDFRIHHWHTHTQQMETRNGFQTFLRRSSRSLPDDPPKILLCDWLFPFIQQLSVIAEPRWEKSAADCPARDMILNCVSRLPNLTTLTLIHFALDDGHRRLMMSAPKLREIQLNRCELPSNFEVATESVSVHRLYRGSLVINSTNVECLDLQRFGKQVLVSELSPQATRNPFQRLRRLCFDHTIFEQSQLAILFSMASALEELHLVARFHSSDWAEVDASSYWAACPSTIRQYIGPTAFAVTIASAAKLSQIELWDDLSDMARTLRSLVSAAGSVKTVRFRVSVLDDSILDALRGFESLERLEVSACFMSASTIPLRERFMGTMRHVKHIMFTRIVGGSSSADPKLRSWWEGAIVEDPVLYELADGTSEA